ncbi:unnamed protein product [Rhodiola kirilowii]
MDSSNVVGAEECTSSSESGWTMYIGSPSRGVGDETDADERSAGNSYCVYDENLGSDDSMASDACSGPSNRQGTGGFDTIQEDCRKFSAGKKACKQGIMTNTRDAVRNKVDKTDTVHQANTAYSHVRSRPKLSKRK